MFKLPSHFTKNKNLALIKLSFNQTVKDILMPRNWLTPSHLLLLVFGLGYPTGLAVPLSITPIPEARAQQPLTSLVPQPQKMTVQKGLLPLKNLNVALVGTAPELSWAARDLGAEWQTRLGLTLGITLSTATTGPKITIGTVATKTLADKVRAAGLTVSGPESYALWIDKTGAYIVGADGLGAYHGAQTLRQLLTATGLPFTKISDAPALKQRIAMIYLDQYSQGVNDRLIPMLAAMKFNSVLIMSDYVQWDTAKTGGYAHPSGASKAEAKRVADLARSYGLEVIPLIETLAHVGWMFYGNKNQDLRQDVGSQSPYAYDTLNPETYSRVILPILKEAVELFNPKVIHIGHDEVRNRDRFPARENGKAIGYEKLLIDDTLKIHDYLKSLNVGTMIWHDNVFSDSVISSVPAQLPKDIQVAYWSYDPGNAYPMLSTIQKLGFPVLGASWSDLGNAEGLAKAATAIQANGMIQTRWTGYFGNPSIWDGAAEQGVAYIRAGANFWNPNTPAIPNADLIYRDLYQPTPFKAVAGATVNLKPLINRSLTDNDETGWINKGPDIDLRNLKTGVNKFGAYTFDIQGAVMLKGSRSSVKNLPNSAIIEIGRKANALAFLQTAGWPNPLIREQVGHYEVEYADGSKITQPLEYGRHIRAWTDIIPSSMILTPAWAGKTKDGLDVAIQVLEWVNPKPNLLIKSVTLFSEGKSANPTLLGLTLIGQP